MTQQLIDKTTAPQAPSVTTQPTRNQVINRIIIECAKHGFVCNVERAKATIDILEKAVAHYRETGADYVFTQRELNRCHTVMDIVMPDSIEGAMNVLPGSAYAGLNSLLLGATI